jgi:hypothetical protein
VVNLALSDYRSSAPPDMSRKYKTMFFFHAADDDFSNRMNKNGKHYRKTTVLMLLSEKLQKGLHMLI